MTWHLQVILTCRATVSNTSALSRYFIYISSVVHRCCSISSSISSTCTSCSWPALSLSRSFVSVPSTPTGFLWYVAFYSCLIIGAQSVVLSTLLLCSVHHLLFGCFLIKQFVVLEKSWLFFFFFFLLFNCWLVICLQGLVLIITIMREAVEEIRCYLRDKEVNSQIYSKLSTRGEQHRRPRRLRLCWYDPNHVCLFLSISIY